MAYIIHSSTHTLIHSYLYSLFFLFLFFFFSLFFAFCSLHFILAFWHFLHFAFHVAHPPSDIFCALPSGRCDTGFVWVLFCLVLPFFFLNSGLPFERLHSELSLRLRLRLRLRLSLSLSYLLSSPVSTPCENSTPLPLYCLFIFVFFLVFVSLFVFNCRISNPRSCAPSFFRRTYSPHFPFQRRLISVCVRVRVRGIYTDAGLVFLSCPALRHPLCFCSFFFVLQSSMLSTHHPIRYDMVRYDTVLRWVWPSVLSTQYYSVAARSET